LVGRPPIVLLDEPTSAMDLPGEKALIERLKAELINQTIVVITHRSSIIELIDHVLVMDQGRLVAQGPKSDFMKPRAPVPEPTPSAQAPSGKIGATVSDNFGYGTTG
jgi:ATP-binding cassette subfamily C protein LapB